MRLNSRQIEFFRQSGYLKISQKVGPSAVKRLSIAVEKAISKREAPYECDELGRIVRIPNLIDRDPMFLNLFRSRLILDPLEGILGPNIELSRNRHNHATVTLKDSLQPRLHRDVLQWSRSLVSVVVYLEESTVQTGCTHIIPGSQYLPFVGKPNNGGTWMDEHEVFAGLLSQAVPVPMAKGGILFFDALIFHAAGVNVTDSKRMSLTAGYHSVDELTRAKDIKHLVLVRGKRIYKGK